jgi:FkbH-like protein
LDELVTIDTANSPFRFAVAATFTAEPLRPVIAFWSKQLNANFEIRFAPYNQLAQTLLNPASELGSNTHGVNIVLARLEDLGRFDGEDSPDALAKLERNVHAILEQIRASAPALNAPVIVCLCPSSPAFLDTPERHAFKKRMMSVLSAALDETPGVQLLHYEQIDRWYPVDVQHDAEGERLGKIPYTEIYYCALGTALVRYTHALRMEPFKVVALDCDNTLWNGICGEDGPEGVVVDPPRRELQEFIVEQREAGMLLTMASKNNEQDILDTFAAHPEMPLSLRHFTAWRWNWQPKAENLRSLSEELGLGLDSFIFIDDNPKECAELSGELPEVLSLALPEDIERMPEFLNHVWAFDHPVVTEEDRNRNVYYSQQQEFGAEVRRAASLQEFMAALDLRVAIHPIAPEKLARVSQLTQRTNQFNLTTIRRTESEIQSLGDAYEVYTADVSDRFGDYGLTGVVISSPKDDALFIDTFLLSCRVLGRGVEHRIAAFLGQTALSRGLSKVVFPYRATRKNAPARDFLNSIHFAEVQPAENGFVSSVLAAQLAHLRWTAPVRSESVAKSGSHSTKPVRRSVDYAYIANRLAGAPAILQAIRSSHAQPQLTESMTETEGQLAHIWADLLERPSVSLTDNFFDLGGHSLLAVLLLLRIRESFGVELSIDDVYSGTLSLSDLAARIETAQLGGVNPEDYAALLAEIEGLSDEEARQLLAAEDSANT